MHLVRPSAPLVVATLALLVAAAQPGYAAMSALARNTVGSPQIKANGVHTDDLADKAVTSVKIKNGSIKRSDLAAGSIGSAQLANGSVGGADLAAGSVDFSKIADGTVGRSELSANSVDGSKITDGSIAPMDLAAGAKPAKAGGWTRYPSATTGASAAIGATLTSIGALSTDGGGAMTVSQASLLVVSGQVRVTLTSAAAAGTLDCIVYVNGANAGPTANVALAAGTSTTVPISGLLPVGAGTYDVAVSCLGSNATVRYVRVSAVAFPT